MGFFDFLDRMAKGEPIFQEDEDKAEKKNADDSGSDAPEQPIPAPKPEAMIQKGVESSFPLVHIRQTKVHGDSNHIQVYCHIANTWPEEVELDKIRIFNTKRELDTYLRGHEEREFLVYDGPALTREYHEAQLDYKTQKEGDYFETIHDVTFTYRPQEKVYVPATIELHHPVRDIYG